MPKEKDNAKKWAGSRVRLYGRNGMVYVDSSADPIEGVLPVKTGYGKDTEYTVELQATRLKSASAHDVAFVTTVSTLSGPKKYYLSASPYKEAKEQQEWMISTLALLSRPHTPLGVKTVARILNFCKIRASKSGFDFQPLAASSRPPGITELFSISTEASGGRPYGIQTKWGSFLRAPAWGVPGMVYQTGGHCAGDEQFRLQETKKTTRDHPWRNR